MDLVEAAPGKFATISLTSAGMTALRERRPITLTKQPDVAEKTKSKRAGAIECDEKLFDRLRALRRKIADERDVPAYVIFSDVSLREMARILPTRLGDFARVPGVGEQKLKNFGAAFISEISEYLKSNEQSAAI
jgi:ATP-dependent DNA helicase RecQ